MSAAKIGDIEIPLVSSVEISREFVGDRARTAAGRMRQDLVAVKRTWQLRTRALTAAQATAIIDYLSSVGWGAAFWLDDFGYSWSTVDCIVPPESIQETHVSVAIDGVWYDNAREISLQVVEI